MLVSRVTTCLKMYRKGVRVKDTFLSIISKNNVVFFLKINRDKTTPGWMAKSWLIIASLSYTSIEVSFWTVHLGNCNSVVYGIISRVKVNCIYST